MTSPEIRDYVGKLASLPAAIGADLTVFGGILRCSACSGEQPLGEVGDRIAYGWPKCCGLTMTWVTAKELAEERREVPEGYHLEAVPDTGIGGPWIIDSTRRCRWTMPSRKGCGKPSVAVLLRGPTKRPFGYCPDHMYGRWIEDGKVMCWVLRKDDDA